MLRKAYFILFFALLSLPGQAVASELIGTWEDSAGFEATISSHAQGEYLTLFNVRTSAPNGTLVDEGLIDASGNVSSQNNLVQTVIVVQGILTIFFSHGETSWTREFQRK